MKMVKEATFNELEEADPVRQRLEAAGIQADIKDRRKHHHFWGMAPPIAAVHLRVPKQQYEQADHLLHTWDSSEGILKCAIRCPECDSFHVEFPQFTRKFLSTRIEAGLFMLHILERRFYCKDCHYTWPLVVEVPKPLDPLGWPARGKGTA